MPPAAKPSPRTCSDPKARQRWPGTASSRRRRCPPHHVFPRCHAERSRCDGQEHRAARSRPRATLSVSRDERRGGVMDVELINVQTPDGVGSTFYGPSFFDTVGDALVANGTAILRVNSRGHDQAYHLQQRRLGAAYEVIDDCRLDFTAWLDFAAARGFRRVALWGHSLGAVKTIYFLSVARDPRVICAVASSPPRFVHQAYLDSAGGAR